MKTTSHQEHHLLNKGLTLSLILAHLILLGGCGNHQPETTMHNTMVHESNAPESEISALELHKLLTAYFGNVYIKLSDAKYRLPNNEKVVTLGQFHNNADWDCDDYAIAAMVPMRNYAFGMMYITTDRGERHVANVFINQNREIMFWEAQKNEYYHGKFHKPELIVF